MVALVTLAGFFPDKLLSTFSGTVPPVLPHLETLVLFGTRISGSIPPTFTGARTFVAIGGSVRHTVSGTLPNEWGTNGKFVSFALVGAEVSGTLPAFKNASKLRAILKKNNLGGPEEALTRPLVGISGTLPAFTEMPNLVAIVLNSEHIEGTLPQDLFDAPKLTTVWLASLKISGTLPEPTTLRGSGVVDIDISGSGGISGTVPQAIGGATDLISINFRDTKVSGTIPVGIGSLTKLQNIFALNTSLSGSFPESLGSLTALNNLMTFGSLLGGRLPASFASLTQLGVLDLSQCDFEGHLDVLNLTDRATNVHIQGCRFSGTLPALPRTIISLIMFNNFISGTIPEHWFEGGEDATDKPHNLEFLSLSNNALSGTVPEGICRLTKLVALTINNQRLSGSVPACIGKLTSMEVLSASRNFLTGSLPNSMNCLLYTSDAADEEDSVDLGGRRIIKKKKKVKCTCLGELSE
eukprot:TRINITY_DN10887_c0_g1_i1.p1 TRINITY_DN10887_c0_g1~~TRINITY_DN10887_c0_g1_i1.p1  ORF type:complete len:467 (+),score=86.67 TRINITY_DN10887_c0_g1_i1:438-1838(+)